MIWRRVNPLINFLALGIVLSWGYHKAREALTPRTEFWGCTLSWDVKQGLQAIGRCDGSEPLHLHVDGQKQEAQTWTSVR